VTPEPIFQVASGFMAAKHLFVVNELGVLTHLAAGPATLDDLAQRVGIPRRTRCILVDAMVALGFVERQGERYQNGPVAATFLSGRTPRDLWPFLRLWDHFSYPKWTTLAAVCRTDDMAFQEVDFTEAAVCELLHEEQAGDGTSPMP